MIALTETLQKALDELKGQPLKLVDPRTNLTYVLVPEWALEQMQDLDDEHLDSPQLGAHIDRIMQEEDEGDPLLEQHQKLYGKAE